MGEHNIKNGLQFPPLAIDWIANDASGLLGNLYSNQDYIVSPPSNGIHLEPLPIPPWMHYQPMPQNYVEFLAERGYPQMSFDISAQVPNLGLANPSQLEEYLKPHDEGDIITTVTGLEHQTGIQNQIWNEECSHAFDTYSGSSSAASKCPSEARRKKSRDRSYAATADRCRRLRISHWLDALQELVPHSEVVDKTTFLDIVIDYIRFLQNLMKDICRSRLGGELTSNSVIFLEGHGHYFVQEQTLSGPLEETMGKLVDVYPSAATDMLQSRGLLVMPMTFAEELLEAKLDVQEKGALLSPINQVNMVRCNLWDGHDGCDGSASMSTDRTSPL
ncbi:hypothetical protein ACS0TY_007636 [Phlomoides rotata]